MRKLKKISDFITHISIVLAAALTVSVQVFGIRAEQIRLWIQAAVKSESVNTLFLTYPNQIFVCIALVALIILWVVLRKAKRLDNPAEGGIEDASLPKTAVESYLDYLNSSSSFLPFGDYSTLETATSNQETRITLDEVWTDLRVSVEPSELGTDVKNKAEEYIFEDFAYSETQADGENRPLRLILLGEPGSGKSSSLARLAIKYCQAREQDTKENVVLPISVRVDQVDLNSTDPIQAICQSLDFDDEMQRSLQVDFSKAVKSGAAIFLIDGLDELAENDKGKAASFLEKIVSAYPLSRVIASCRTDDFYDSPDYSVLRNFNICTLQPYSFDDVLNYITKWYSAFGRRQSYSLARCERDVARLEHAIKADNALLGLARTPLLTALICLVHAIRSELPRTRSLLYDEGIQLLLTGAWRGEDDGERPSTAEAMSVVSHIAYEVHVFSEQDGGSGRYGISEAKIGEIIDTRVAQQSTYSATDQLVLRERSATLMRQILNSNSLIVETGSKRFKFSHRAFQEFLVGQYFASGSKTSEVVERAGSLHWAEPFRLLANYSSVRGGNLFYILFLCSEIFRRRSDVLSRCLVGEMLSEIGAPALRSENYGFVIDDNPQNEDPVRVGIMPSLWSLARSSVYQFAISEALADNHELRLRLFRSLSELGDPRLVCSDGDALPLSDQIVYMEKRTVPIGHRPESDYLKNRLNNSNALKSYPIRKVVVDSFSMSRYLVTNLDFQRFMAAGGYKNEHFWPSDSARSWLRGDPSFQNKLFEGWLETAERDYKREISDETMSIDSLRETAGQVLAARQKPYYWDNPRFRIATAPVVGVNLWEAAAYCNWLTEELRSSNQIRPNDVISVPTEFEWERAARDCNEAAEYPWGDEWDEGRGHVNHGSLDLSNAAPVGMFPRGSCPNGPMDLSGNVWEWTTSAALNLGNPSVRDVCFNNTFEDIVVRGSSWYNSYELARSGIRQCDRLYNIYFDLGFRWVLINQDEHEHEKFV